MPILREPLSGPVPSRLTSSTLPEGPPCARGPTAGAGAQAQGHGKVPPFRQGRGAHGQGAVHRERKRPDRPQHEALPGARPRRQGVQDEAPDVSIRPAVPGCDGRRDGTDLCGQELPWGAEDVRRGRSPGADQAKAGEISRTQKRHPTRRAPRSASTWSTPSAKSRRGG